MDKKWKPKYDEIYYSIVEFDIIIEPAYSYGQYYNEDMKNLNYFKTKKEAKEVIKKIKQILREAKN